MHRTFIYGLALVALAAGCQNPAWRNPYAMIGPATVPPPGAGAASGTAAVDLSPARSGASTIGPASGGAIRTEIAATPRAATSTTSSSGEAPIRIVEATPATTKPIGTKLASTAPIVEPQSPAVVTATPTSRSTAAPAVKFNPSTAPAQMSQLPRPPATVPASTSPAINRTRGYIPAQPQTQPAPAAPRNRLSSAAAAERDSAVVPATFVETTTAANGQWKAR